MMPRETATLGGGCFWCLEAVFEQLDGVEQAVSGYAGGTGADPTYREVCSGTTGHAEVVQVTFDPTRIAYREILEVFLISHDPTTLNRQGADMGSQYRSIILCHSAEQLVTAREAIAFAEAEQWWPEPIVTEVVECGAFFPAEAHHQDYFQRNLRTPYCLTVILPKVLEFRKRFAHRLKVQSA